MDGGGFSLRSPFFCALIVILCEFVLELFRSLVVVDVDAVFNDNVKVLLCREFIVFSGCRKPVSVVWCLLIEKFVSLKL